MAGYKLESAYIGVTGRHISSLNNRGTVAITNTGGVVRQEDLKRVLAVATNIKIPPEQKILHIIPRAYLLRWTGSKKSYRHERR